MPTLSSYSKIIAQSGELVRRLQTASSRNRKGQLNLELKNEIIQSLKCLADLATKLESLEQADADPSCSSKSTSPELTSSTTVNLSTAELEDLVSRAITNSLTRWQASPDAVFSQNRDPVSTLDQSAGDDRRSQLDQGRLKELELLIRDLEIELSDQRKQLFAANDQLAEAQSELREARSQLEDYEISGRPTNSESLFSHSDRQDLSSSSQDGACDEQVDLAMQEQLEELMAEVTDLREQNSDLASQLAQKLATEATSVSRSGKRTNDQLSWEERKMLILQQLEGDGDVEESQLSEEEKLEVQGIIESTQREIARRDEQIEELREIIRMQSDARDGVAIGAVGLAGILDSDALVQEERSKLREIQQEWEAKLRQAEIDLSMERAKIARERSQLEKQLEELKLGHTPSSHPLHSDNSEHRARSKERRWLNILGLGEESTDRSKG